MGCGDTDVAIVSPPTGPAHPSRGRTSRSSAPAPPPQDPAATGALGTLVAVLKGAAVTSLVIADLVGIAKDMLAPTFLDEVDLVQQWGHVREIEDRE
jgi:hypothetical protein